jgi:glycerophosphoryl diester phosphodiesterase
VRLFRGRLEVRHLKSLGPLPLLWDRWELARRRPALLLDDLLSAAAPGTHLLLDLKGPRRRLGELVLESLKPRLAVHRVTVSARWWRLLEPFEHTPVRRVCSIGSARGLRALLRHHGDGGLDGVAVHERLLDARVAGELRRVAEVVLTWPVNDVDRARELVRLGADGLISDRAAELGRALAGAAT